ncbi:hypothetical protein CU098_010902 [Rhizopus stolonifer]|uniref:Uncharacterized protein n=1 Tax=Rhizopus stolonifer TaxID=4846 RepID=A0A367KR81_RHIST|nr:hypothetical protein CU098_010902 [Rhizopus stolonifer]
MPNKTNFQPKDARAVSITYRDDDDDDMSDLFGPGKRMMTGTQALVDFLKTTSPEEFQRTSTSNHSERSVNTLFSRIRKTKRAPSIIPSTASVPSSTISLPASSSSSSTLTSAYELRKPHIEIVPQKTKSATISSSRSPSFHSETFVSRKAKDPILPNKKRESSLYSGSLRHSVSVRSHLSTVSHKKSHKVATDQVLAKTQGMDMIESALLQRLERLKTAHEPRPSDQVAAALSAEHIRALGITHLLDNTTRETQHKKNVRHMQVQTEQAQIQTSEEPQVPTPTHVSREKDPELRARRAEVALENAMDHFEVMSGLAYKRLRELWEEKMRWENACMELRDRLLLLEQEQKKIVQDSPLLREDYLDHVLVEEEDELGLSEFPISELC